jgi:hypothetical protein
MGCPLSMRFSPIIFSLAILLAPTTRSFGHAVGSEMSEAALNFIAALSPEQRTNAMFTLNDEQRFDWHYIPRPRKGLAFRDMTFAQQTLAEALIQTPLSHRGYFKAATIMTLDQVLYEMENHAAKREPGQYSVSIFGTPGKDPWGWRVEGHHLSLNFTIAGGEVSTTPSFMGSNPAEVKSGPRAGLRVLGREEDLAHDLMQSLTEKQRALAIFTTNAPHEIITGNSRRVTALKPVGISAAELDRAQRKIFMDLLREYVFRYRDELADADWKKIERAGPARLHFGWAGGTGPGEGHYYRIQGPTFLMEYDKTQDNANHIHTVWRDLENDFGEDLLRQHYDEFPHGK